MLQIGSVLDGKYKILNKIGQGGMSTVYLALNERANKTWAVKEVRKDGVVNNVANQAALVAETEILRKLHHPGLPSIVDILDYQDSIIIVEDYIEGQNLDEKLKREGAQKPEKVRSWGMQVCSVLNYLHSQTPPIIYRDMKPANLMLNPNGKDICIIDFGTAKTFKYRNNVDDTIPLGTPGYAAPEQYGGRGSSDARTDIYNTGATLYHLLTGWRPDAPPYYKMVPLRRIDPAYQDSGWEQILAKCCQANPDDRYQTAAELYYDLEHIEELDKKEIKRRKRRMGLFIASVGLCLLGAAGMLGFHAAAKNAETETYGYFLDLAEEQANVNDAQPYYRRALKIDPSRPDVYQSMINAASRNGRLDDQEISVLRGCLNETFGGARTSEQLLQAADPQSYDGMMYDLGVLWFFMHDNSVNDMKNAASCFGQVQESPYLSAPQLELARILYKIGTYYEKLTSGSNIYTEEYSYTELWNDLCDVIEGNVSEKVGRPAFAVALYNQMAYQIFNNCERFNSYGVTREEMLAELDSVRRGLAELDSGDPAIRAVIDSALETEAGARRAVDSFFDRRE